MQMIGLAEIQLAADFSYEGGLELNFKAKNTRNLRIFVEYVNLAVTWLNKLLSGEFRRKVVIVWSSQRVSWLLVQIFFSREICVIRGKMHIIDFGYRHGILVVFWNVTGQN